MSFGRILGYIFSNSLPRRAFFVVGLIICLGFATAIGSAFLAYVAENDAKAINSAGSLRMATYRINYILASGDTVPSIDDSLVLNDKIPIAQQLTDDMDKKIEELTDYQRLVSNHNVEINNELSAITMLWQTHLKPAILDNDKETVFRHSSNYINLADNFVHQIQIRNEKRQLLQQALQIGTLLIIGVLLVFGIYEMLNNVLKPIKQLWAGTKKFSAGERVQVHIAGYDEFNDLGNSFNEMAGIIYEYQQELQNKVAQKTADLLQVNQALRLLYDFANQLNREPLSLPKLYELIYRFSQIIPNIKLSLCVHGEQSQKNNRISVVNLEGKDSLSVHSLHTHLSFTPVVARAEGVDIVPSKICQPSDCHNCELKDEPQTYLIPIRSQGVEWGELMAQDFDETGQNFAKHEEILYTLANLIAIVFNNKKQRQQENQLVLEEERSTIARELHDSLAQSLSYLKMQLAMMGTYSRQTQQLLDSYDFGAVHTQLQEQHNQREQILEQTRTGLDGAYRQLRELLVTFRLKIESGEFDNALASACDEFAVKGGFEVQLNNRVLSLNLTANEQIDLLQITREALSNIQRHAQASTVTVELFQKQTDDGKQMMYLTVCDDGVGLNPNFDTRHHHGLSIMQERTHNLGGEFSIGNHQPTGTKVEVSFLPKFFNHQLQADTPIN